MTSTETERVSRRRPVWSTFSALSLADHTRLQRRSRCSPAATPCTSSCSAGVNQSRTNAALRGSTSSRSHPTPTCACESTHTAQSARSLIDTETGERSPLTKSMGAPVEAARISMAASVAEASSRPSARTTACFAVQPRQPHLGPPLGKAQCLDAGRFLGRQPVSGRGHVVDAPRQPPHDAGATAARGGGRDTSRKAHVLSVPRNRCRR